jgi:hypothetical protein
MDRYLAYQNGRDLLTKFALETLWNAIWYWYGLVLHPLFLPKPHGRSNTRLFWLRLCRAATFYSEFPRGSGRLDTDVRNLVITA